VTVRGYRSIPVDQLWFFTSDWQRKEREADRELAARGASETFPDGGSFISALADPAGVSADEFHRPTH
jgi:hypothetical protein